MTPYTKISPPDCMLAQDWQPHLPEYPCIIQPKLNGVRCLLGPDGRAYKRSGLKMPVLNYQFGAYDIWLDGEIYIEGMSLQRIAGLCNRKEPDDLTYMLRFHVFDVVTYDSCQERMEYLTELPTIPTVYKLSTYWVPDGFEAARLYNSLDPKAEGLIYRDLSAPYIHGRTKHLLKRKQLTTAEYKCVGVQEGLNRFSGTLGAFVCITPDDVQFNVSAAELTDIERKAMWANPPFGEMLSIRYPHLSDDGIPQQAQFECVKKETI
jgi:ATP-dependent DNA ligase